MAFTERASFAIEVLALAQFATIWLFFAAYLTRSLRSCPMASIGLSGVTVPTMTRWKQSVTMVKR